MKIAIIAGNGKTRENINLLEFGYPIFACNAAFRNLNADYVIAMDDAIIQELMTSDFPEDRILIPKEEYRYEPLEYSPFRRRENSGMIAMRAAIENGFDVLYAFGMDFLFDDESLNMGNIYDGTNCYGPETRASIQDCINRMQYLNWFAEKYSNIDFIFIYPDREKGRNFRPVSAKNIKVSYIKESFSEDDYPVESQVF